MLIKQKVIACEYHKKISNICSDIDFFHKLLHDSEVKNPFSSIQRIELSVKFKLFQCHDLFTVLCLSLDWKIYFNLDFFFFFKLFKCSKQDFWCVLLKTLRNDPTKLWWEKAGQWSYGKLVECRRYREWTGLWQQWLVEFIFCFCC